MRRLNSCDSLSVSWSLCRDDPQSCNIVQHTIIEGGGISVGEVYVPQHHSTHTPSKALRPLLDCLFVVCVCVCKYVGVYSLKTGRSPWSLLCSAAHSKSFGMPIDFFPAVWCSTGQKKVTVSVPFCTVSVACCRHTVSAWCALPVQLLNKWVVPNQTSNVPRGKIVAKAPICWLLVFHQPPAWVFRGIILSHY